MSSSKCILVTGASSGFGLLMSKALARAGHRVYASMRGLRDKNVKASAEITSWATGEKVAIHPLELDILSDASCDRAVEEITAREGQIDVLINNAGMLVIGVSECFTPDQVLACLNTNVVGHFRVCRAVLPAMRAREDGLLIHIGSVTSRVISPFQGPYVAAKTAWDALAETIHYENARYGIDTVMVQPGAYTGGTNHFAGAQRPADAARESQYSRITDVPAQLVSRLGSLVPEGARTDPDEVAEEVVKVVAQPKGSRPFRIVVDPQRHGAEHVNAVAASVQHDFMRRMGIADMRVCRLTP
ncbi:MAG: SDR family NAD(P)-dependent oxidoreductase [Planctomycetota bacterium]|nr:SDR family NAD(P)-dependent oxidoreductase [Planctomycetota bacterium]